jgi:hypothetical protein
MSGKPQQFLTAFGLAGGLALTCAPAHATFILDMTCGVPQCAEGRDFFIDNVNKDVQTFTGTVGGHLNGPAITVETSANVDTGTDFASITPTTALTALIFTPADDTLFTASRSAVSLQLPGSPGGSTSLGPTVMGRRDRLPSPGSKGRTPISTALELFRTTAKRLNW